MTALREANAHAVTSQLLVGGDLDDRSQARAERQLLELVEAGVTHIADVRVEWSDEELVRSLQPHVRYLHHGVDDAGQRVPASWFETGVRFVLDGIASGGVVLCHCHMGINRGPSLGFAAMLAMGWDPIEALTRIREVRPIAYVAYAEDALAWHVRDARRLDAELDRVATWRRENRLDLGTVIRQTRAAEQRGS